ncbi:MAG: P1 family peptidase [Selenomonadaceae bacterium]|nr:P1 family peptidase [Selenomonadaceae bacterium]
MRRLGLWFGGLSSRKIFKRFIWSGNWCNCRITNGNFDKTQLTKIASMTQNAYARSIKPVGILADGDTIYAASVGEVSADLNMVGTLAAEVMSEAIRRAVDNKQRGNDIE